MLTSAYEGLYRAANRNMLWGCEPGRLLALVPRLCLPCRTFDAGCGDGKNSLHLEQRGFELIGVDSSKKALDGLANRFAAAGRRPWGRYSCADVGAEAPSPRSIGLLLSYGLFHCLPEGGRRHIHARLQAAVRPGGLVVFSCLTDDIPLSSDHLTPGVAPAGIDEVRSLFRGWRLEHVRCGLINESHPPLVGPHAHSAIWLIARRPA